MSQETIVGDIFESGPSKRNVSWIIPEFFTLSDEKLHITSPPFVLMDNAWFLMLYMKSYANPESMTLFLRTVKPQQYSVDYSFYFVKEDGSLERLVSGVMGEDSSWSNLNYFMKISDLKRRRSELAPNDTLHVICHLRIHNFSASKGYHPKPQKLLKLQTLSQNFKHLFTEKMNCDITLCVKSKEYQAHKAILIARSKVFAAMFQHESLEKQTGRITITDCDPGTFQIFLEFFYCGEVDVLTFDSAYNLYKTSHKYQVEELKSFCIECLISDTTVENFFALIFLANFYEEQKLMTAAQNFYMKNYKLFQSSAWANFLNAQVPHKKQFFTTLLRILEEKIVNVE